MKYDITAQFDEAFVRRTTHRFLIKFLGWDYFVVLVFMVISLIAMLVLGMNGWFVGVVGAVTVMATGVAVAVWHTQMNRALTTLRRMTNPEAQFIIDDSGIAVSSDLGSGSITWQAFQKMWCFPEAWLLFVSKGAYSTMPTACLTPSAKQFILDKLNENNIKISQPKVGQVSPEAAPSASPDEPST
jgi:hypothetical protein